MSARRTFGASWWGDAWIRALEERARLDANRLPRGRTYARQDRVPALVLDHGEIRAAVEGSRPEPYRVAVRIRTYDDADWDRLFDAIAAKAGHAAALLDGELDPAVDADARAVGITLLPTAGDLEARCTCPDRANPCKHAAAVFYLVADRLDEDPFELLHLRGRSRDQVRDELRRRRRAASTGTTATSEADGVERPPTLTEVGEDPSQGADDDLNDTDAGVRASTAWAAAIETPPTPPPTRPRPGHPAPWPSTPPDGSPFDAAGLRHLAVDAARRAWAMTAGVGDGDLDLPARHDLARRAADALGEEDWELLLATTGERPARLRALARAWRQDGSSGVDANDEPAWDPPDSAMDAGLAALSRSTGGAVTISGNRVTDRRRTRQLRLGTDRRWYRFDRRDGRWELAAPGVTDPDDLV